MLVVKDTYHSQYKISFDYLPSTESTESVEYTKYTLDYMTAKSVYSVLHTLYSQPNNNDSMKMDRSAYHGIISDGFIANDTTTDATNEEVLEIINDITTAFGIEFIINDSIKISGLTHTLLTADDINPQYMYKDISNFETHINAHVGNRAYIVSSAYRTVDYYCLVEDISTDPTNFYVNKHIYIVDNGAIFKYAHYNPKRDAWIKHEYFSEYDNLDVELPEYLDRTPFFISKAQYNTESKLKGNANVVKAVVKGTDGRVLTIGTFKRHKNVFNEIVDYIVSNAKFIIKSLNSEVMLNNAIKELIFEYRIPKTYAELGPSVFRNTLAIEIEKTKTAIKIVKNRGHICKENITSLQVLETSLDYLLKGYRDEISGMVRKPKRGRMNEKFKGRNLITAEVIIPLRNIHIDHNYNQYENKIKK